MLHTTGSAYFQALYSEIYTAYRNKEKTDNLKALLEEISINIRDPSNMTVAGKYASEGRIDIAHWCHNELGALPSFIVEGLIRGSQEKPELEALALTYRLDEEMDPIALVRGYAFIANQEKVEQCLVKYPHLYANKRYVMEALAISALLGNQIDYYKEIQTNTNTPKTLSIAHALGTTSHLSLIQWFLSKFTTRDMKLNYLFYLIQGFMQGPRDKKCLKFLKAQVHAHNYTSKILHSKAIGAAQAGNIKEAQAYLKKAPLTDIRESATCAALGSGYKAGAQQLYDRKVFPFPSRFVGRILSQFQVVGNGIIDALPALLNEPDIYNASFLKKAYNDPLFVDIYEAPFKFSAGLSPFWDKSSARHFLGRISEDRVVQFLLPVAEKNFGSVVKEDIKTYVRKINKFRTAHDLNYPQAACFFREDKLTGSKCALWVTNKTLPSVETASGGRISLPRELMHKVTSFLSPVSPLTGQEAGGLHHSLPLSLKTQALVSLKTQALVLKHQKTPGCISM